MNMHAFFNLFKINVILWNFIPKVVGNFNMHPLCMAIGSQFVKGVQ